MGITVPTGHFVCECCGLWYPIQRPVRADVEARMHQVNTIPKRCARCGPHRALDAAVLRAEDHMQWYWELSEQKDAETKRMRAEVQEASVQVSEAKDQTSAALRSRDAYVLVLARLARLHEPIGRGCSCRRHNCETGARALLSESWVQAAIRKLERRGGIEEDDRYDGAVG